MNALHSFPTLKEKVIRKWNIPFILLLLVLTAAEGLFVLSIYWLIRLESFDTYSRALNFLQSEFSSGYMSAQMGQFFFTQDHFLLIKDHYVAFIFLVCTCAFLFAMILIRLIRITQRISDWSSPIHRPITPLVLLFGLWIIGKTALYYYMPLHIDEVFDYIYFSKQSFILRQSYVFTDGVWWYNNHMLYTHLSALLHFFNLPDKLCIRLPAMGAELGLLVYLVSVFRKGQFALYLIAGLLGSFWLQLYSVEGRSYYLIATCCMLIVFESFRFFQSPNVRHILYLVPLAFIGMFASKLFLIPLAASGVVFAGVIILKKLHWKEFAWTTLAIILGTMSIYFPASALGGIATFYAPSTGSDRLTSHFPMLLECISVITSINVKAYLGLIFAAMLFIIAYKRLSASTRFFIISFGVQFVFLLLFTLVTKNYLPFRAMIYLNALFITCIVWMAFDLGRSWNYNPAVFMPFLFLIMLANTFYLYNDSWLKRNNQFILDRPFYDKLSKNIHSIEVVAPSSIYVEPGNNFYLFYLSYVLGDQVLITEDVEQKSSADIIISSDAQSNNLLFEDIEHGVFVYN